MTMTFNNSWYVPETIAVSDESVNNVEAASVPVSVSAPEL